MASIEDNIENFETWILGSIKKLEDKCIKCDQNGLSEAHFNEELQHLTEALKQLDAVKKAPNKEEAFGHYQTQLTGNAFRMAYFSNNYLPCLDNVREDLEFTGLNVPHGKVCDFGCGQGFTTISLMSALNNPQVLGIDNNETVINEARSWIDTIKQHLRLYEEPKIQDEDLNQRVCRILNTPNFPEFVKGDIIKHENLPANIDLAYCRRFLVNIYVGAYEKTLLGDEAIKLAIKNLVETIKPGGWFLAVEEYNSSLDFRRFFSQFNLEEKKIIPVSNRVSPMIRYFYQKVY